MRVELCGHLHEWWPKGRDTFVVEMGDCDSMSPLSTDGLELPLRHEVMLWTERNPQRTQYMAQPITFSLIPAPSHNPRWSHHHPNAQARILEMCLKLCVIKFREFCLLNYLPSPHASPSSRQLPFIPRWPPWPLWQSPCSKPCPLLTNCPLSHLEVLCKIKEGISGIFLQLMVSGTEGRSRKLEWYFHILMLLRSSHS